MQVRFLSIVTACLIVSAAHAQMPPGPPPGGPPDMERMAVLLDLNDYQKTEVKKLLEAQRQVMESRRQQLEDSGERPSREAMLAERERADAALLESLRQVLTDDQLTKFKALADRRPPGPPRGRRSEATDSSAR